MQGATGTSTALMLGAGDRHEGFTEADNVADDDTAAFLQVASGDLHGGGLEVEKRIAEI